GFRGASAAHITSFGRHSVPHFAAAHSCRIFVKKHFTCISVRDLKTRKNDFYINPKRWHEYIVANGHLSSVHCGGS
ncbi:hypothetical protein R6Q57_008397, partial [Mikania cordata]